MLLRQRGAAYAADLRREHPEVERVIWFRDRKVWQTRGRDASQSLPCVNFHRAQHAQS